MVIAGSDKTTRRRVGRRQRDAAATTFGSDLRQARENLGLSLEAVQDRTGVRRFDLEALEDGDPSRFLDEKTALIAVRRYAEIVGLDAAAMVQTVGEQWRTVTEPGRPELARPELIRANRGAARNPIDSAPLPVVAGHLSRYPGDASHLKAFTQTAQVPQVAARTVAPTLPPGLRFDSTDSVPVTWRGYRDPDPAPLALRVAVWSTLLLLGLGVVGLAVHHWRPAWLADIHLVTTNPPAGTGSTAGTTPTAHGHLPLVTQSSSGPLAALVTVRSPVYSVVVTTEAPCWVHVTSPASFSPLFSATVPAGTTKTFTSANGQLSVELGASHATLTLQVLGKTVPGWTFSPAAAPFTVNFHSSST